MDALAELLKTAQCQTKPMRHRMRAAQQALRALPTDAPEAIWRPFRDLFDEVVQHLPPYAEALRADAASVALWWDGRRRPVVAAVAAPTDPPGDAVLSASLTKMRQIMLDDGLGLNLRLDAAEVCLDHELGPGAGVGVPPDQIASQAYQFCRAVADSNAPEIPRFRALRALVRIENARARNDPNAEIERRRLFIATANAARRQALVSAGVWRQACVSGASWALTTGDTFDMPAASDRPAGDSISTMLDRARSMPREELEQRIEARKTMLLSVRARNRIDDWERLLEASPAV